MRKFLIPKDKPAETMPTIRRSTRSMNGVKKEDDGQREVPKDDRVSDDHVKEEEDDDEEQHEEEKEVTKKATGGGLSAFERRRLENIAANQALLKDLSATASKILPRSKASPAASSGRTSRSGTASRRREAPVKREAPMPTRRSSRVAGLQAESFDENKRKLDQLVETESSLERAKKMRISGDVNLGDALVEGKRWSAGLDGLQGLKGLSRGAQPGLRTFTDEDVDNTTDEDLKALRLRMNGLKLYEKWLPNDIKITPSRVYCLGFHPTEDKPVIFAGDKEGAVGVFDASQDGPEPPADLDEDDDWDVPDPVIGAFKLHTKTTTSFVFSPTDANAVFTSSYDSTIRKLDLDKGIAVQIFAPADPTEDMSMSAMDMPTSDPNLLYFSTLDGSLGRHDIRTPASEHEAWSLCDNKIGGFSLHPAHPHLVATASLDRTLKIWDLRKISGKGDERHPALLGEHRSRLSVSHAAWSGAGHVATTSYDDTIKIYDFGSRAGGWAAGQELGEEEMEPAHVVRHNNQTGRWVTILKPKWQMRPRDGIQKFVIGNMNRFVDVFAADGEQLAQLDGDGITAVPAVAHFHPTMDWVAGGNNSGKLTLWM